MFAERVSALEAEGAYAVLARANELEAQGRSILHLEIGQPDFPTFPNIREVGVRAIEAGMTRYTAPAGMPELRRAIAETSSKKMGLEIRPARVVVAPGAKPGLFFPTLALVNPGDEVIYPDPGFPTYEAMIRVAGGVPVPVRLDEAKGFSFDLKAFDRALSKRTKMIVINSPGNPTGGVLPLADLQHIAAKAQEYDCWVISDEIYGALVYEGKEATSIASLPGMLDRTVVCDGFSKTYSMTGWRLGYMILPETLAERVELLLTHSIGCTAAFTQAAGIEALRGPQERVAEVVEDYQRRRDFVAAGLNSIGGIRCKTPQGAFYAFPNVESFGMSSKEIAARLLDEAGVAVLAGTDFGAGGEGHLRLCYATAMPVLEESLERMEKWFRGI